MRRLPISVSILLQDRVSTLLSDRVQTILDKVEQQVAFVWFRKVHSGKCKVYVLVSARKITNTLKSHQSAMSAVRKKVGRTLEITRGYPPS